jgi:hypothetical protein
MDEKDVTSVLIIHDSIGNSGLTGWRGYVGIAKGGEHRTIRLQDVMH